MPKTTVDLPSEVLAQLEKLQKEKGFEYLKDAYLYALKHGLGIMENNIEKGIEQRIQIREPIAEPINAEEPSETQIPPCPYASLVVRQNKNGLEYLAYCDNPKKTNLPKDRLLPTLACQKCHERTKKETEDLDAETVFKAFDLVSQQVECSQMNQTLPIYRLPCFHEYLEDDSIIDFDSKKIKLKCTHECKFRHSMTIDAKGEPILRMALFFMFTRIIGSCVAKMPQIF
jgi:hypothetical protein